MTITPTDTLRIGPVGAAGTFQARAWAGETEVATTIKWWIREKTIASLTSTECTSPCSMTVKGLALGTAYLDARDYNGGSSPPRDNAIIKVMATAPPPDSAPPPDTTTPPAPPPPSGSVAVVLAAGDIATCSGSGDEATAKLLDANPGATVLTLGDNVYEDGTATQFANCYGPTWGRHKSRTRPSPGNHDYHTSGAAGYYAYFGTNAGPAGRGYYSYDLGNWHLVSLNSEITTSAGSAQEQWLRADLASTSKRCVLAYWHNPRFSSGDHGSSTKTQPLWQALQDAGADIVLASHDHSYERFAPMTATGTRDDAKGIRSWVVGTGGRSHYPMETQRPNSEVFNSTTYGVLKLSLGDSTYAWEFLPVAGATFTDKGSGSCTGQNGGGSAPPPTEPLPPPPSPSGLAVFPGAVGFGTTTPAGRGGQLIRVTNLNDDGTGSLRAALSATGPRVVVFEVSGTLVARSHLSITHPYLTVAGQTAPSPGITIRGAGIKINTHDVLVQHLRVRTGDDAAGPDPESRDAVQIAGTSVYNVVLDHVSSSWGIDENVGISTTGTRRDMTISNSIVSEGLSNSLKGYEHSKGMLVGQDAQRISVLRTVLAHNRDRNAYFKGGTSAVFVNNVVYDWGNSKATFFDDFDSSGPDLGAVVGNVYLTGPSTPSGAVAIRIYDQNPGSSFYVADNTLNRAPPPANPWSLVTNAEGSTVIASQPPVWPQGLIPLGATSVESWVLTNAGARPVDRDAVDARIATEVRTRTGRIIDNTGQVGGWPSLAQNTRPFAAPATPGGDDDGDGYTNLEEVLHQMAAQVEGR